MFLKTSGADTVMSARSQSCATNFRESKSVAGQSLPKSPARQFAFKPGSNAGPIQQRGENFFRFEDFAGNFSGGARMFRIIGVDRFHRLDNFLYRAEREQPPVVSVMLGKAALLNNDGAAGCEIARAPIAEPTGV